MSTPLLKYKLHGYTSEDDKSEQIEIVEVESENMLADKAASLAKSNGWVDYWAEEVK